MFGLHFYQQIGQKPEFLEFSFITGAGFTHKWILGDNTVLFALMGDASACNNRLIELQNHF